jgi:hypothetical protein
MLNFQGGFAPFTYSTGRRDSAVGTATGYVLDDKGVRVRVSVGTKFFSFSLRPDPACYPIGNGFLFPGVKGPGREADRTTPTSAEDKNP